MNRIAIVFPIYNNLEFTKRCLDDINNLLLKDQLKNNFEIVITDDGSTDGSSNWISKNYPDVHILEGDGSLWWSGGINKAIKFAINNLNIEYILLWNNDVIADKYFFKNCLTLTNENKRDTIYCSKILSYKNKDLVFAMGGLFNSKSGKKQLVGRGQKDDGRFEDVIDIDWFCGQGTLIHKSVFNVVGYFDEKVFPQYHGDSDFALRTKKKGFDIKAHPVLKIYNDTTITGVSHINNKTIKQFFYSLYSIKSNYNIRRNILFYNRHASSILAYRSLLRKFIIYTLSYIKWKTLRIFGIKKADEKL